NNEEAAYWVAAIIEISKYKGPEKDMAGGKTKKAWADFCKSTGEASAAFAKASASKNAANIKSAADKLYSTCVNCHSKFK
ncbi:MAG TPA: hypothetical protein VFE62_25900, partial [Gemmataceae bacterium]|nr:hypothetical protein [Gemmataceae bacterium]